VIFDLGSDEAFHSLGLGPQSAGTRGFTTYTAEAHVRYLRELHLGTEATVSFQLIDHDAKRLHSYQEIIHQQGWVAATCQMMTLRVDQTGPKVAPLPPDIAENVARMAAGHAALPRPEKLGRPMGIPRSRT